MLAHPTVVILKLVGCILVNEYVNKDLAVGFEPSGHFRKQVRVPLHVFEHLDRENMGESGNVDADESVVNSDVCTIENHR